MNHIISWLLNHKEIINLLTGIATVIAASVFGILQILINKRLAKIQDFVSVAVTPLGDKLKITNLGKIDLYLSAYKIKDQIIKLNKGSFLSSSMPESAYHWLPITSNFPTEGEFEMEFHSYDRFGKNYITEVSGSAITSDSSITQFVFSTHETRRVKKYEI